VGTLRRKIERWRRTRKKRTRMPEELWSAAVKLAQVHGVWRIAKELSVRYESLKQRVVAFEEETERKKRRRSQHLDAKLVEVLPTLEDVVPQGLQCIVELRDRGGATMTIRLAELRGVDLAGLTEAFWKRRR
jgi:hypothetical protein